MIRMAAKLQEITATFLREDHRFNNPDGDTIIATVWINGEVCKEMSVKGQADLDELQQNQTYRFYGTPGKYKNRRTNQTVDQFTFQSFVLEQPRTQSAIIAYLKNAGEGHNFGHARALKCWELYGSDAVKMCREDSARVADDLTRAGLRLTDEQAEKIAAVLQRDAALEGCTLELNDLLAGRGFRKTLPKMLIRELGNEAAQKLRADPFLLIEGKYPGCGFKNVDKFYLSLGHNPSWLKRQAYAAWHAINSNRDGHTWMPRTVGEAGIKSCVAGTDIRTDEAIQMAIDLGMLRQIKTKGVDGPICEDGNRTWLAIADAADREERLAHMISDAMDEPFEWPDVATIENIDGEQPEVLAKALQGCICILAGRPGTGKTFTAANLIKALIRLFGWGEIGIGAPTNLAAQRLSEAMAGYGVNVRARTWHSMLGRPLVRGREWNHCRENPLPYRVIVGDEESMKDTRMMEAVFAARARGTMVLLIGDINQLPPVDRGAPLRDLIAAGLPCGELKQIRRNSGGIVEACAAICEGRPWGAGDNLEIVQVDKEEEQLAAVIDKLRECSEAGFDPIWDSRVIVARNETRRAINKVLQVELNRNPGVEGSPFRVGDKVINTSNTDFPVIDADPNNEDCEFNERGDSVRVNNGEVGEVIEVYDSYFVIKVLYPDRIIKVIRGKVAEVSDADDDGKDTDKTGTGCSWDLAYAVTYHKSQGSEFPWPIIVASSRDGHMGSRELVYTGISRGKAKCKLIGWKSTFDKFCRRVALKTRKTLLKERILLNQAMKVLVDL